MFVGEGRRRSREPGAVERQRKGKWKGKRNSRRRREVNTSPPAHCQCVCMCVAVCVLVRPLNPEELQVTIFRVQGPQGLVRPPEDEVGWIEDQREKMGTPGKLSLGIVFF